MTWFRVGGAGIPASLKNAMNAVFNKKFGTSGQNYPPNTWPDNVNLLGPLPEKTASGAIAHIEDGADDVPMKSVIAHIAPTLTGTNAVNMVQSGDSVFFPKDIVQGSISVSGYNSESNYRIRTYVPTAVLPNTEYHIKINSEVQIYEVHEYQTSTGSSTYTTINASETTITTRSTTNYIRILFRYSNNALITPSAITYIQCTAGTLTPYTTYTANLGRTVYGADVDLVNGQGTDSGKKETMTSSYISGLASGYTGYVSNLSVFNNHPAVWIRNFGYPSANQIVSGGIGCVCNHFPVSMNNSSLISTQYRIYFDVDGKNISSVQDFIDYVENLEQNDDSLDIVYEVSVPETFTFDGQEIPSLLGVNNLWADEGDSDVTYRADISLALQALGGGGRGLMGMMMQRPEEEQLTEEDPEEVSELEENIQNTEEQEGENDAR